MLWSAFNEMVDELLAVERRRLGVQPFIDRQVRLGVGDVQRLIDYYRKGITTTIEYDEMAKDGFSSKLELPKGASLRELYHVKTGKFWVRRPLYEYPYSNRNDLRAGTLNVGYAKPYFRYALHHVSGARTMWVYPRVMQGYAVQVVWDALIGRGTLEYQDADEVPFDEPVADLVYEWVKWKLAREVDRDLSLAREHERGYRAGIARLYSEVQERLRLKRVQSDADCDPACNSACTDLVNNCGGTLTTVTGVLDCGYYCCPVITAPQTEWAMVGDSGQQSTIEDTIAVATAIKALDPEFLIHLGDVSYATTQRPGQVGTGPTAPSSTSGAAHILFDLFKKHYWNFWEQRIFLAFGNHDLETLYGQPLLDLLVQSTGDLIGQDRRTAHQLWYTFARGPVRFIVLNSGIDDSDANISIATQLTFVEDTCEAASEPWIIVVFHRPAYTSDSTHKPGSTVMASLTDDLKDLGVDLVVSAHGHNYERILDATGLLHVNCGLGGAEKRGAATSSLPTGSQFFYNDNNGFLHFKADAAVLQWEFRTTDNEVIDRVTLRKADDPAACSSCTSTCLPVMYSNCCNLAQIAQVYSGTGFPTAPPYNQESEAIWYSSTGDVYGWDKTLKTWIVINVGSTEAGGAAGFFVADTFAAMRTIVAAASNKLCVTKGLTTPFDNGGRPYVWNPTSTAADDGISICKPNMLDASDAGRWEQL